MIQLYKGREWHQNKKGEWVWVEGYAKKVPGLEGTYFSKVNCEIYSESVFRGQRVKLSTLCRYTEIDHKGKKIFENDLVREWVKDEQEKDGGSWSYSVIKMHQGSWCVCGIHYEYKDPERLWDRLSDDFEICGSIFDHPELSKEGKN